MIADYLESNSGRIRDKIETTDSQWKSFLKRLKNQELQGYKDFYDEQVWTFLVMSWYADNNTERIRKLVHTLTLNKNLNVGPFGLGSDQANLLNLNEILLKYPLNLGLYRRFWG
jgi:hypothetical protein